MELNRQGSSRDIASAAFRTDGTLQGDVGADDLTTALCCFPVCIADMLLLMGTNC